MSASLSHQQNRSNTQDMKPLYPTVLFFVLTILSCGEMPLEPGQAIVAVKDSDGAKVISATSKSANILPAEGQSLIIIQDVDTALYVVAGEDTLGVCDAVYHDPAKPWEAGKSVVVVKDNMAYCFTVIANKDGSLALQQVGLPKDGKATVEKLPNNQCGVRNMAFDGGGTYSFDFSADAVE